jgi:hypothetical protein
VAPQHTPATAEQLEEGAEADVKDESFHPIATFADGECVGASAAISFDVTVPGGGTAKIAGVTSADCPNTGCHRRLSTFDGGWRSPYRPTGGDIRMTAVPPSRSTMVRFGGAPSSSSSLRRSADWRSFSSLCLPGEKLA